MDPVFVVHRGVERSAVTVHKDRDVFAKGPSLVEDPSDEPRMVLLQSPDDFADGSAADLDLRTPARKLPERRSELHDGHAGSLVQGLRVA